VDGLTSTQHGSQLSPRPPYPYGKRPVPIIRILCGPQCRYDRSGATESSGLVTIPATKSQLDKHEEANKRILQTFNVIEPKRLRTCANYSNAEREGACAEFRSLMYFFVTTECRALGSYVTQVVPYDVKLYPVCQPRAARKMAVH
jgi:hypothetical protein